MKRYSNKDFAIALYEATKNLKGETLNKAVAEFAKILFKNGATKRTGAIIEEFERYEKKAGGVVTIEVNSAHEIKSDQLEKIKKVFGTKVNAETKVDRNLLGGIKIITENIIFDGSIAKQLQLLKKSIN